MSPTEIDYEGLMLANLHRVFGERDGDARKVAIAELYAPDALLYEPDNIATGHVEIESAVETLLQHLPPEFVFTTDGPAIGHHAVGRLRWRLGPPEGPAAVTGTDVVRIEAGQIAALYVFLDPAVV